MRGLSALASLITVALFAGCANPSSSSHSAPSPHAAPLPHSAAAPQASSPSGSAPTQFAQPVPLPTPVITPDLRPTGRVQLVNTNGHFVVVSFANNFMPSLQDRLGVFRDGSKIGEIKITGPQREYNIVGEILSGAPQVEDQVKPN